MDKEENCQETAAPTMPQQEETVLYILLKELHPFPNHPYKIRDDDALREMTESVKRCGVLIPAIVRPRKEGGYEIIAGHRRKRASELAEIKTLPAIVRDLDDDAATIFMVDSNIQRENVLPSERAKAYKMKLEAIKRQGARTDLTSDQLGQKLPSKTSREIIAENSPDSSTQIQRYIRLNELSPQLQQMVDDKKIAMTPAVEISYLKPEEQTMLVEIIGAAQTTPTLAQTQRLKQISRSGGLDREAIYSILGSEKPPEQAAPAYPPPKNIEPHPVTAAPCPKPVSERGHIADDILRLKDTTKDCSCTPEIFLAEFADFASSFFRGIELYALPYYEPVFPVLSQEQLANLRQQMDSICAAVEQFYDVVKGVRKRE